MTAMFTCLIVSCYDVVQLSHSRKESVKIVIKEEGIFEKKKNLFVAAARDLSVGEVLSVDMAPGKLESQVRTAIQSQLSACHDCNACL